MADFLPRRDDQMVQWTRVFAQGIQDDPAGLGLSAQQAADYATLQQDFAAAFQTSQDPMTRGVRTVLIKDEARKDLVAQTRELARLIRAQPGVSPVTRLKLGLLKAGGEAVGAEGEALAVVKERGPRLKVAAPGRRVEVSVRRYEGGRRRPTGTVGAAVYWFVGERAPGQIGDWHLAGNTTKPEVSFVLPLEAARPGAKLWVVGRWLDRKLQPGEPGPAVCAAVGYGIALAA